MVRDHRWSSQWSVVRVLLALELAEVQVEARQVLGATVRLARVMVGCKLVGAVLLREDRLEYIISPVRRRRPPMLELLIRFLFLGLLLMYYLILVHRG